MPLLLEHAKAFNRLGVAYSVEGRIMEAFDAHHKARQLLEQSASNRDAFDVQLDLAETMILADTVFIRSGAVESFSALNRSSDRPPPGANTSEGPPRRPPPPDGRFDGPWTWRSRPRTGTRRLRRKGWNPTRRVEPRARHGGRPAGETARLSPQRFAGSPAVGAGLSQSPLRTADADGLKRANSDLQTAVDLMTHLEEQDPKSPTYRFELADLLCIPPATSFSQTPDEETIHRLERAIQISEQLLSESPTVPEYQALLGSALKKLAAIEYLAQKYDPARVHYRRAIELQKSLVMRYPSTRLHHVAYVKLAGGAGRCRQRARPGR